MACNCVIAAHDNLFNKTIISDNGYYFSNPEDIKNILIKRPLASNESNFKMNNLERINSSFNWEKVVDDYEQTFYKVHKKALY
jgi:glycosyltransferase involved in cell wall biosynthesis